jgi:hypothetical protein
MFDPPFGAPRERTSTSETPDEHENVTAWRPNGTRVRRFRSQQLRILPVFRLTKFQFMLNLEDRQDIRPRNPADFARPR